MVLTGDEAATRSIVDARLVVATVTIPEKQANKIKETGLTHSKIENLMHILQKVGAILLLL